MKKYRSITVIITILWTIYNFAVGAYVSAIGSLVSFASAIIAIVRLDIIKEKFMMKRYKERNK